MALRLLILWISGGVYRGQLECLRVRKIQGLRAVAFHQLLWMPLNVLTTRIPPLMCASWVPTLQVGVNIPILQMRVPRLKS